MTTTKKTKWHVIGNICIDTGTLLLCDPCNVGEAAEWEIFTDRPGADGCDTLTESNGTHPLALAIMTGLGDGLYPVEVRYEDVPGFGERVAEVRIKFLPHPMFEGT